MHKVKKIEKNHNLADKALKVLKVMGIGTVIVLVICNGKEIKDIANVNKEMNTIENQIQMTTEIPETLNNQQEQSSIEYATINYENALVFYNLIMQNKEKYGEDFANAINSYEDIKSLMAFINKFNEMYYYDESTSIIKSRQDFESLIYNYFTSCIKYKVKPNLNLLFNDVNCQMVLAEAEDKMYDMIINNQNSFTENYLRFVNEHCVFYNKDNKIDGFNKINAPLINIIDIQLISLYDYNVCNIKNIYKYYTTYDLYPETEEICPQALIDTLYKEREETLEIVFNYIEDECQKNNSLNK